MPARTNPFQRLITLIERMVAPSGAVVTESKMLVDSREKEEREVDICIEAALGTHTVVIGVECIDRKRKATVEWIDQIIGKFRNLPVDKVIGVSRSGFTQSAKKKAQGARIVLLTLDEAATADWVAVIDQLKSITVESFLLPHAVGVSVTLEGDSSDPIPSDFDLKSAIVRKPDGTERGKLAAIADAVLADPGFVATVEKEAFLDAGTRGEAELRFAPGSFIIDSDGTKRGILAFKVEFKCRRERSTVGLDRRSYGAAQVAYGSGTSFGKPVTIAVVESVDQGATIGVSIEGVPPKPKKEDRTTTEDA